MSKLETPQAIGFWGKRRVEYLKDEKKVSDCFKESCERNNIGLVLYDITKKMTFK